MFSRNGLHFSSNVYFKNFTWNIWFNDHSWNEHHHATKRKKIDFHWQETAQRERVQLICFCVIKLEEKIDASDADLCGEMNKRKFEWHRQMGLKNAWVNNKRRLMGNQKSFSGKNRKKMNEFFNKKSIGWFLLVDHVIETGCD